MTKTVEQLRQHAAAEIRRQAEWTTECVETILDLAYELRYADIPLSVQLSEAALQFAVRNDYPRGRAYALRNIAWCQILTDKHKDAQPGLEDSRKIFVNLQDEAGLASVLSGLGATDRLLGKHEAALELYAMALSVYRKINDQNGIASVLNNLGVIHNRLADRSAAIDYYYQTLQIASKSQIAVVQAQIYCNLGDVLWRTGETSAAISVLQHALSLFQESCAPRHESIAYVNLGAAHQSRGEYRQAFSNYSDSLKMAQSAGNLETQAEALLRLGSLSLEQQFIETALGYLWQADELTKNIQSRFYESETLLYLGQAYNRVGDLKRSIEFLEQALEISAALQTHEIRFKTHLALSEVYEKKGETTTALFHHRNYHQFYEAVYGLDAKRLIKKQLLQKPFKWLDRKTQLLWSEAEKSAPLEELRAGLSAGKLKLVQEFIEHQLESRITLADLASLVAMSQRNFQRVFKLSTGRTAHQYVLERRVARAQLLLQTTAVPLAEIAVRCGFSDQSHLTVQFRFVTGQTPRRFRQSL